MLSNTIDRFKFKLQAEEIQKSDSGAFLFFKFLFCVSKKLVSSIAPPEGDSRVDEFDFSFPVDHI